MSEIIFGTQEHIAGLSREALEADFRYVQDRRMELEEACERLQAENTKLRELVRDMWCNGFTDDTPNDVEERVYIQMEELGISTKLR